MAEAVDLHDATLTVVRVDWADGTCGIEVQHGVIKRCILSFTGLSHLTLPRKQDWGPSISINSFRALGNGQYEIAMQSGDVIRIEAANMTWSTAGEDGRAV